MDILKFRQTRNLNYHSVLNLLTFSINYWTLEDAKEEMLNDLKTIEVENK